MKIYLATLSISTTCSIMKGCASCPCIATEDILSNKNQTFIKKHKDRWVVKMIVSMHMSFYINGMCTPLVSEGCGFETEEASFTARS